MKIPVMQENGYWKMEDLHDEDKVLPWFSQKERDQSLLYLFSDIANQLRELNSIMRKMKE